MLLLAVSLCTAARAGQADARERPQEGALKAGDPAPNFALKGLDGKSAFTLSEHLGQKPVVLVFGSYT